MKSEQLNIRFTNIIVTNLTRLRGAAQAHELPTEIRIWQWRHDGLATQGLLYERLTGLYDNLICQKPRSFGYPQAAPQVTRDHTNLSILHHCNFVLLLKTTPTQRHLQSTFYENKNIDEN